MKYSRIPTNKFFYFKYKWIIQTFWGYDHSPAKNCLIRRALLCKKEYAFWAVLQFICIRYLDSYDDYSIVALSILK